MDKIQRYLLLAEDLPTDKEIRAALATGQILVYGLRKGNVERYSEELLSSQAKTIDHVKQVFRKAGAEGWHSFRVAGFREGTKPNFAGTVNRKAIPENLPEESTCAIHTIAFVLDKTPEEVWEKSREYWASGRVKAGITGNDMIKILNKFGYGIIKRPELTYEGAKQRTWRSVFDIVDTIPDRPFIIGVDRHVLGIKDGEIKDTFNTPPKKKVNYVMEVVDKQTADNYLDPNRDPLAGKYVKGTTTSDDPDDETDYFLRAFI